MCFGLQGCESREILGHDSVRRGVYPVECVCACVASSLGRVGRSNPFMVVVVVVGKGCWSRCVCVCGVVMNGSGIWRKRNETRERERVARPGWLGVAFFLYTRECGLGADKIGVEGWGMRNGVCVGFEKENRGLGCEETGAISGRHAAAG